jgi:protein-S-isoprenylcysteine O-methyltransferase Ste14
MRDGALAASASRSWWARGVGVAGGLMVFYDFKARAEDRLLDKSYSGADDYRVAVARFIPGVY